MRSAGERRFAGAPTKGLIFCGFLVTIPRQMRGEDLVEVVWLFKRVTRVLILQDSCRNSSKKKPQTVSRWRQGEVMGSDSSVKTV